jgi:hypothetical protein
VNAREIFRRTGKTLKARLSVLAKSARARAASARKSLASVRKRVKPKTAALAKGARRHAAAVWQALGPVRKRLEPIAQRVAPAWNRLGPRTKRAPWRVALVAAVVLAMLLAMLGGGARFGRALFAFGRIAPLPSDVRLAVREQAKQLAAGLDARLDKKRRLARMAGVSARMLIALTENDPAYAGEVSAKAVEKFFRSVAGPECFCWRKAPDARYPDNVGVTAWVLWALAGYRIPAHRGETEFLLSSQRRDGAWAQFSAVKQERFASTYATAAAVVALEAQSKLEHDPAQSERVARAVQSGATWLQSGVDAGQARWADYPAWPDAAERKRFLGLSGFALFALHRAGAQGLAALDRDWLRHLPAELPAAGGEAPGKPVRIGTRSYTDDTRYYDLPWAVLATVLAYPNGSLFDKVAAMRWLERQLGPGAAFYEIAGDKDAAGAAEMLFALRDYPEIAGP